MTAAIRLTRIEGGFDISLVDEGWEYPENTDWIENDPNEFIDERDWSGLDSIQIGEFMDVEIPISLTYSEVSAIINELNERYG